MKNRKSVSTAVIAVIIVIVIIIAGIGGYYYYLSTIKPKPTPTPTPTPTTKTITIAPPNPNELVDIGTMGQIYSPDSLDPATGFYVVDEVFWANVYQGLVTFNGSSNTQLVPVLAKSWEMAPNGSQYIFIMRPGTYFSNLHPINATTAWFNFVRIIIMAQGPGVSNYYPYIATFYGPYFLPYNISQAVQYAFHMSTAPNASVTAQIVSQVLSNFNVQNSTIWSLMTYPHQAIVVLNSSAIEFNLAMPYRYFPYILAGPGWGALVDPVAIDHQGGVQPLQANPTVNTEGTVGSGPYMIESVGSELSSITLVANPHYWAANASNVPWVLAPAKIPNVVLEFGASHDTRVEDFDTGEATISDVAIPSLSQIYAGYQYKQYVPFNDLFYNAGVSPALFYIAMNNQVFPTKNADFRLAVAYAINYSDIISTIMTFNGTKLGFTYLGPVDPTMPFYDPQGYPPYSLNLTLAEQYINESGWQEGFYVVLPNGQTLGNSSAKELPPLQLYTIAPVTPTAEEEFEIIQSDLAQIGISMSLYPVTAAVTDSWTTASSTPAFVWLGWAPDWPDPIAQEAMVLTDPVYGGTAGDIAWVNNTQLNNLYSRIFTPQYQSNATMLKMAVEEIYNITYHQAPYAYMPNTITYWLQQPYLKGVVYNPYTGYRYNLMYYQNYTVTVQTTS